MFFILAGLLTVLLPHMGHLPVWMTAICISLLIMRLLVDMQRLPLPNRYIIYLLFALIVLGVFVHYHTIVGREAGTALLLSLICLKLFEIKSFRDISLIVQLAFFAIVVTFLFSQSVFVALTMLLAVVLLITALIDAQHAKTDQMRLALTEKDCLRLGINMVAYAIPLAVVIFIFFPRTSTPLWGLPNDAYEAKTGLSNEMSPGRISKLVDSTAVAFRVKFKSKTPVTAKLYWRGPVFWAFDGHTWSAPLSQRLIMKKIYLNQPADPVEYTITQEPNDNFWLFALAQPGMVPDRALITTEMQLLSRKPINHLKRYTMLSYLRYSMPWLRGIPRERYLQVPPDSAPRARKYVRSLEKKYPDKEQIVKAVLKRFSDKQYYYTRNPPLLEGDPTDAFFFDSKRGYCEHYASSFTVLMRLAGIPARVVTGYLGGEMNPLSDYLIVRQSDAHAWSEIYLEGKGWVRVDPTAVIPESNIEDTSDIGRFRSELGDVHDLAGHNWLTKSVQDVLYAWDMVNNSWNQWVVGYSNQNQKSMFRAIGIPEISWRGLSYVLFATLFIFTLVVAVYIFQSQRVSRSSSVDKIYGKFLRKLQPLRVEKAPCEGALDFSMRVSRLCPEQTSELVAIADIYNRIRYAERGTGSINTLKQAVKSLRIKCK